MDCQTENVTPGGGETAIPLQLGTNSPLQPPAGAGETNEPAANVGDTPDEVADNADGTQSQLNTEEFCEIAAMIESCTGVPGISACWHFLKIEDSRHLIDMDTMECIGALANDCGPTMLVQLGLCELDGDELRLATRFDSKAPLYVTIDRQNRKISFSQNSEGRTALDYARERAPVAVVREPTVLYVVESDHDVDILQRLGLPAATCQPLETLGRDEVIELFAARHRGKPRWRYHLVLLDFHVAEFLNESSPAIAAVIERLANAGDTYQVDPAARFTVCRPTVEGFRALSMCMTFQDPDVVRDIFERWSAAAMCKPLPNWRVLLESARISLPRARADLIRALAMKIPFCHGAVAEALPPYRAALQPLVHNLFSECYSASNPYDQLDSFVAGTYAEQILNDDPLVRRAEAVLANETLPPDRELQKEFFEMCQKLRAEFRQIRRDRNMRR